MAVQPLPPRPSTEVRLPEEQGHCDNCRVTAEGCSAPRRLGEGNLSCERLVRPLSGLPGESVACCQHQPSAPDVAARRTLRTGTGGEASWSGCRPRLAPLASWGAFMLGALQRHQQPCPLVSCVSPAHQRLTQPRQCPLPMCIMKSHREGTETSSLTGQLSSVATTWGR